MDKIGTWAGNIAGYLVFVTVLTGLLPASGYGKYLRLFSGCILILLVFQPLTGSLRLEEPVTELFRTISFTQEVNALSGSLGIEMEELEERKRRNLVNAYRTEVEDEICRLAETEGVLVQAEVKMAKETAEGFPRIERIVLRVKEENPGGEESFAEVSVDQIHVAVSSEAVPAQEKTTGNEERLRRLKKRIAGYYQMEEAYVEIRRQSSP